MAKKNALGRGLGSLLGDAIEDDTLTNEGVYSSMMELPLTDIIPNPFQPRKEFNLEALEELASSIKSLGVIQPITVKINDAGKYEIVAGERRYRASKIAGLDKIPAYVLDSGITTTLEMALVENIQRQDLNSIEIADSYQSLIDDCGYTQDALSAKVGKKRTTITNYLRLLKLPDNIKKAVKESKISMGHARALLGISDPEMMQMIFEQIIHYQFSVRKVEEIIHELSNNDKEKAEKINKNNKEEIGIYSELQDQLSKCLNTCVKFRRNSDGKGKIVIPFKSDNELEKIVELLDKIN